MLKKLLHVLPWRNLIQSKYKQNSMLLKIKLLENKDFIFLYYNHKPTTKKSLLHFLLQNSLQLLISSTIFRNVDLVDKIIKEVLLLHSRIPFGSLTNQDLFYCQVWSIILLLSTVNLIFKTWFCSSTYLNKQWTAHHMARQHSGFPNLGHFYEHH